MGIDNSKKSLNGEIVSFAQKAARGGLWFSGFKFITQVFSWIITVVVARILVPEDYGLMAMASILTGYVQIFSEMGLGAAIIQKKEITEKELSSVFWLSFLIGCGVAAVSFSLAYPTAWIFNEQRVIPITQLISTVFIISALMIVPYNILSREIRFKEIGLIQLISVGLASLSMLWMANKGFGVWTLINGTIIQRTIVVILTFLASKWWPIFHFNFEEAKPLLAFGVNIAGSRSLFYFFQKADKFIVGKMFNAQSLGYYSFAMELANIPTDKVVSILQQVCFPVFSRYQDDLAKCQDMYLKMTKFISLISAPLLMGGVFFGKEIILNVLGEKWRPIIFIFRMFCITQFFIFLTEINGIIHYAQGKPHYTLIFNLIRAVVMSLSIFIASNYGLNALMLPWVCVYPFLCIGWAWITLRKLNIPIIRYLNNIVMPIVASGVMVALIISWNFLMNAAHIAFENDRVVLIQEIIMGAIFYSVYLLLFEKKSLAMIWSLRR